MTGLEIVSVAAVVLCTAGIIAALVGRAVAERCIAVLALDFERKIAELRRELASEPRAHAENKKTELLIEKQAEAAAAFFAMRRAFDPEDTYSEVDDDESLQRIVERFPEIESNLEKFIAEYGVFLDDEIRAALNKCSVLACNYQFVAASAEAKEEATYIAHEILAEMKKIEDLFATDLRY